MMSSGRSGKLQPGSGRSRQLELSILDQEEVIILLHLVTRWVVMD